MRALDATGSVDFTPEQLRMATCLNYTSLHPWHSSLSELESSPEKAMTLTTLVRPREGNRLPRVTELVAEPGQEPESLVPDTSLFCISFSAGLGYPSSQAFFSGTVIHNVNRAINFVACEKPQHPSLLQISLD